MMSFSAGLLSVIRSVNATRALSANRDRLLFECEM